MKAVGIVVEYNPFHNGHLYHLNQVKELFPGHTIIAIMSGNFMQRGQISLISKWDKTNMALNYGVDIVLDLPFVFANESADYFAEYAIKILNHFQVESVVFGSESNNKDLYLELADIQLNNDKYQNIVKEQIKLGMNYPSACSKALEIIMNKTVKLPNDILGLAYTKSILKNAFDIEIVPIMRTSDFHSTKISEVSSATSIREALINNEDFQIAVPKFTYDLLTKTNICSNEDLYLLLQYKILISSIEHLKKIHLVSEGIESKLKKEILNCTSYEQFVKTISSKRYTYSRISRMLINILIDYTKVENSFVIEQNYHRVLGVSESGISYLGHLKRKGVIYHTNIKNIDNTITNVEYRCANVVKLLNPNYKESISLIKNMNKKNHIKL